MEREVLDMIRLIIAGGRKFNNYDLLKSKLDHLLKDVAEVEIVSGKCDGADRLGEQYAQSKGWHVEPFPAPWLDIEGKPPHEIKTMADGTLYWAKAGPYRNKKMAENATHCFCFWDGVSKGTKSMIELAKEYKLNLRIIKY